MRESVQYTEGTGVTERNRALLALLVSAGIAVVASGCGAAAANEREELPRATELTVRLEQTLDSQYHGAGSEFSATVRHDVMDAEGLVLIPSGTAVYGHIGDFREDPPALQLEFDRIEVRGERLDLDAEVVSVTPRRESEMTDEGKKIGGGAVAGAILGAVIGGGAKEAVIGAAAGAAAGTGVALATKKTRAYLPAGSVLGIRLVEPLEVPLAEPEPDQEDRETDADGS